MLDGARARAVPLAAFMAAQAAAWPRQQLIVALVVPACRRSAFEKAGQRPSFSRSVAAVGIAVGGERITVALGGVGDRPFVAEAITAALANGGAVRDALALQCRPPDDGIVSAAYRLRLAERLIARAVARAGRA